MELTYRGVKYEREPMTLDVVEGEVTGKYRGRAWRYRYPRHVPDLQPQLPSRYRGVSYSARPDARGVATATPAMVVDRSIPASPASGDRPSPTLGSIHRENIRRALEHRLQVAKASGNERLVHQLEEESQQLALNG